jgi:hypothetical protein
MSWAEVVTFIESLVNPLRGKARLRFVVQQDLVPMINEAVYALMEGVARLRTSTRG